jgi:phosphate starvation-inducible PhoH-like protein
MTQKMKSPSLTINLEALEDITPSTLNQQAAYDAWADGDNLVLAGSAGTGKTFFGLYLAYSQVLRDDTPYNRVVVVRSVVPTRQMGFLPGNSKEKADDYTAPYIKICAELFNDSQSYQKLISSSQLEFITTSFIRGITINNAIIVVDEMQNLNFHELDSVLTRVGKNCRIIFAGDYNQSDFREGDERNGLLQFLNIIEHMNVFTTINFHWKDIVRSGLVRDYIMIKEMLASKGER